MSGRRTAGRGASTRLLAQLVLLGAALWLSGCAHLIAVQAPVTLPARVPVHVFPSVWVAGVLPPFWAVRLLAGGPWWLLGPGLGVSGLWLWWMLRRRCCGWGRSARGGR